MWIENMYSSNTISAFLVLSQLGTVYFSPDKLMIISFYSCEAVSWAELYCGVLGFLQFKEFELYWGAVSFLRSVHTFSWFLKSNWSSDFGHAETGNRVVRKRCLNKNSLVVFCSHAAISLWFLLFFKFLDRIFFSKWFSQSIHSPF